MSLFEQLYKYYIIFHDCLLFHNFLVNFNLTVNKYMGCKFDQLLQKYIEVSVFLAVV